MSRATPWQYSWSTYPADPTRNKIRTKVPILRAMLQGHLYPSHHLIAESGESVLASIHECYEYLAACRSLMRAGGDIEQMLQITIYQNAHPVKRLCHEPFVINDLSQYSAGTSVSDNTGQMGPSECSRFLLRPLRPLSFTSSA